MKSSSCRAIGPSTARRLIWEMARAKELLSLVQALSGSTAADSGRSVAAIGTVCRPAGSAAGRKRIILLLAVLTTLIGAAAVCWFVSPRLAESISPENRSDEYQHSQDFQSSQQHSNGEQPFGRIR